MTQKELWDKFLKVEQQIFKLKFIIQKPLTPEYPILPDFLEAWREDCDRAQKEITDLIKRTDKFVRGEDCHK
jgi:uncharacterized protein Usg